MDEILTSDFEEQFELENPFDVIAGLILESLRNETLQDALLHRREPETTATARAPSTPPESYDLAGAAEHLGMSQRKPRQMVKDRRIAYRNFLFTQADLDEYLGAYRTKPMRI